VHVVHSSVTCSVGLKQVITGAWTAKEAIDQLMHLAVVAPDVTTRLVHPAKAQPAAPVEAAVAAA
jgi:hypothetical protein